MNVIVPVCAMLSAAAGIVVGALIGAWIADRLIDRDDRRRNP